MSATQMTTDGDTTLTQPSPTESIATHPETQLTKKELDQIFTSAVQALFDACNQATTESRTQEEVVKSFYQTLLQVLEKYIEVYAPLGSSTWADTAKIQLASLAGKHIDYSQDAKTTPVDQFNQILQATQSELNGGFLWNVGASLARTTAYLAYAATFPVAWMAGISAPQFGSVLQTKMAELKEKFDTKISSLAEKKEETPTANAEAQVDAEPIEPIALQAIQPNPVAITPAAHVAVLMGVQTSTSHSKPTEHSQQPHQRQPLSKQPKQHRNRKHR